MGDSRRSFKSHSSMELDVRPGCGKCNLFPRCFVTRAAFGKGECPREGERADCADFKRDPEDK